MARQGRNFPLGRPRPRLGWPSTADMTAKLRRVIIAAKFKPLRPDQPKHGGPSYQPGWNWCGKCQCLFFANNATYSACPADAIFEEPHTTGGFAYSVL
jgi:hypothetical protein